MAKLLGVLCVLVPLAIAGVLVARAEDSPYETPSAGEMRESLNSIPYKVKYRETQPNDGLDAFTGTMTKGKSTLDFFVVIGEGADSYVTGHPRQLVRGVSNIGAAGFGTTGEVIVLDSLELTRGSVGLTLAMALEEAVAEAVED